MRIDPDIEGFIFPEFYFTNYEDIIFENYKKKNLS